LPDRPYFHLSLRFIEFSTMTWSMANEPTGRHLADQLQNDFPQASLPETTADQPFSCIEDEMLELAEPPARRKKPIDQSNQLPDQLQQDLVQLFKLLSDETRLRVLMYLYREGELHVSGLCERLQQSQPAVSHHLALMREAELIGCRREGKHNFYSIRLTHFHSVVAQLFQNIADPTQSEFRFDEFILTPRRQDQA
jgi:ArsR family transcriptional regulator